VAGLPGQRQEAEVGAERLQAFALAVTNDDRTLFHGSLLARI